jgi:tetratricopeptide (TPR) repeat protein
VTDEPATSAAASRRAIAPVPRLPLGERVRLALERFVELVFWRKNVGFLRARRAAVVSAHDLGRALAIARVVTEDPRVAPTWGAYADYIELIVHVNQANRALAQRVLQRLDDAKLPKSVRGSAAQIRARFARLDGDYEAMLRHADSAIAHHATYDAHLSRAIALKCLGRIDDAVRALEAGLAKKPNDGIGHVARAGYGVLLGEAGARERLREALDDELLHHSGEAVWLLNVAWARAVLGEDDAVFAALRACLASADPNAVRQVREYVEIEADFARLRDDPRMIALKRDLA